MSSRRPGRRHLQGTVWRREARRAGRERAGRSARKIAGLFQSAAGDSGGNLMPSAARQIIRPYGDRRDDGVVQLSFTFPVPLSEKAKEAAAEFVRKMGFSDVKVAAAEAAVPELLARKLDYDELNQVIDEEIGRRVIIFGACTGTDTHTVGIDAILNMKGYA